MPRTGTRLTRLAQAATRQELADDFCAAVRAEGYDNVVLARVEDGVLVAAPWRYLPDGYAETYLAEGFHLLDPVSQETATAQLPFTWDQVLARPGMSPEQRHMMAACAALGVHSGLTVPLHGADGCCNVVSVSIRHRKGDADPGRRAIVSMLAMQTLIRYVELGSPEPGRPPGKAAQPPRRSSPVMIAGGFPLTRPHLRMLVLVDLGARRWRVGLTRLGHRIYGRRHHQLFRDLESWGLICDTTDDERWRFYLAPTMLGSHFLESAPDIGVLRAEARALEVDPHELPDGIVPG
jgi:Autoinducer binding domain